jgi:hypothetical protein
MIQVTISTTGIDVTIGDFGDRTFLHPTTNFNILPEFSLSDIAESEDLAALILSGDVILKDQDGNVITDPLKVYALTVDQVTAETVTTSEMFALTGVNNGHTVFNSDEDKLCYWNGTVWIGVDGNIILEVFFVEDFESGSFATNSWVTINGGENDWFVGTDEKSTGTYGAYISTDGGTTASYSSVGGTLDVSHLYKELTLPSAATSLSLEFDWQCEAEVSYDYAQIFICDTSVTPVANTSLVDNGTTIIQIGSTEYNNQSIFTTETINLPLGMAGTNKRIVISWRNDNTVENQPPMCIDNIKIKHD